MKFKRHIEFVYGLKQLYVAPLINLVFLLFMFFVLTWGLIMQPAGLKVNLPRAVTSEVIKKDNINILITDENTIYLEGSIINTLELKKVFTQIAARKQTVLIKSDRRASLGRVVEIWDMARDLGIAQINIATNQE